MYDLQKKLTEIGYRRSYFIFIQNVYIFMASDGNLIILLLWKSGVWESIKFLKVILIFAM